VKEPHLHNHGGAAGVIGVLAQETSFQGRDNSGRSRVALVAVCHAER